MNTVATKAGLSTPRRRLLELMQMFGFGRIDGLSVRSGEPVLDPSPRVVREVNLSRLRRGLTAFATDVA